MWNYYRRSSVCYAYIDGNLETKPEAVLSENNRWFRRGWTLQELIAPPDLIFYDASWNRIGSRDGNLLHSLNIVTRIPEDILSGGPDLERKLRHCSIAQRMSWTATRKTSRTEDGAYCLLGIFDVNMPMLYGEGHKAFRRLQEEIIKTSTDHSILARNINSGGMLFATGAFEFLWCGQIDACRPDEPMESYSMTNRGLMITLPILNEYIFNGTKHIEVVLNCTKKANTLTMTLQQLTGIPEPAHLPLEYTVLPGLPGWQTISRDVLTRNVRKIIIVRRSLPSPIGQKYESDQQVPTMPPTSSYRGRKRPISPTQSDASIVRQQYINNCQQPPRCSAGDGLGRKEPIPATHSNSSVSPRDMYSDSPDTSFRRNHDGPYTIPDTSYELSQSLNRRPQPTTLKFQYNCAEGPLRPLESDPDGMRRRRLR